MHGLSNLESYVTAENNQEFLNDTCLDSKNDKCAVVYKTKRR
jgi:hypothetical protein